MGRNIVPRADGDSSLGTASKEYAAIYAKELGGTLADKIAPLDNPVFRGVPTAPTAEPGTNTTQLATTAYTYEALERHNDSISAHPAMRAEITEEINEAVSRAAFDPMGDLNQTYATKTALATTKTELEEKITTTTNTAVTNHNNSLAAHQNVIKRHNEDENAHADIRALIAAGGGGGGGGTATYFYTDGIYTVPAGVNRIYVSGAAGGAGGGYCGGGGGGASVMRKAIGVTPGEKINITIGLGGIGCVGAYHSADDPPADKYNGANGGDTVFGTKFTLNGGKAYRYKNSTATIGFVQGSGLAGGAGATNGTVTNATYFIVNDFYTYGGGKGGDTLFGKGGAAAVYGIDYDASTNLSHPTVTNQPQNGIGYGSGGGGAATWFCTGVLEGTSAGVRVSNGGYGANGIIIIETA